MPANFKAELLACFGQPVSENPTGKMQEAAFRELGLNWRYLTVEVPPARLRDAMLGCAPSGCAAEPDDPAQNRVMEHLDEIAPRPP